MSPAPAARPRGRPATARLDIEMVATAGLQLVDAEGVGALTMRRLARELDVDPMSIYHHLPNKAAVIAAMVDVVFAQMRLPEDDHGSWTDRVRSWAVAYHDLVLRHPALVLHVLTDADAVARAARLIDPAIRAALLAGGVPEEATPTATGVLVDYVNGFALAEIGVPSGAERPTLAGLRAGLDIVLLGIGQLATEPKRKGRR